MRALIRVQRPMPHRAAIAAVAAALAACVSAPPTTPSLPSPARAAAVIAPTQRPPGPAPGVGPPPRREDPPRAPLDDYVRGLESVGDRFVTIEARLDTAGGGVPILVTVEEKGQRISTLTPGTPFEACGRVDVSLEVVQGASSPLLLAQHFCEQGEDELFREIQAFVIHVGDAAGPPRVIWSGRGTFRSSFGVCDQIDVPVAWIVPPGRLRVEQWTEVVARPNPRHLGGSEPCPARPAARRELLETSF